MRHLAVSTALVALALMLPGGTARAQEQQQLDTLKQQIESGKVKAYGVTTLKRLATPALAKLPTLDESGLKGFNVTIWHGLYAPKGTPADVQARIIEEVRKAAASDDIKTSWANSGAEFPNVTGAQFGNFVSGEIKKWAAVVKASGAKLD